MNADAITEMLRLPASGRALSDPGDCEIFWDWQRTVLPKKASKPLSLHRDHGEASLEYRLDSTSRIYFPTLVLARECTHGSGFFAMVFSDCRYWTALERVGHSDSWSVAGVIGPAALPRICLSGLGVLYGSTLLSRDFGLDGSFCTDLCGLQGPSGSEQFQQIAGPDRNFRPDRNCSDLAAEGGTHRATLVRTGVLRRVGWSVGRRFETAG
jgi:hypothetical protein